MTFGETSLADKAEHRLESSPALSRAPLANPQRIPALVRILTGHQGCGEFRGGEPRRPTHRLGSDDQTVAVWDLETGTRLRALTGHQAAVSSVAVSPDGRRIVSGSDDNTVAVWDLEIRRTAPRHSPGIKMR